MNKIPSTEVLVMHTEYRPTERGLRRERRTSGCRIQRTAGNKLKIILI